MAKGTYNELQKSGLDFTSMLKKDEEEEQLQPPQDIPARNRTLSQNSTRSQTSSVHSVKDVDLPVGTSAKSSPLIVMIICVPPVSVKEGSDCWVISPSSGTL